MLIGRFLGALVAACALSLPAVAQIQDLVPHRALYKIRPAPAAAGTLPVSASGTMAYELIRTCDGVEWRQHLALTTSGGGQDIRLEQTWTGSESLDGKRYRFETRSKTDGASRPVIRGSAEIGVDGTGEAKFTSPLTRTVALPADTLFPMAALAKGLADRRAGRDGFDYKVFIGEKPEPPYRMTGILGLAPRRAREQPPPQGDGDLVAGREPFYMHMSFFDGKEQDAMEPSHTWGAAMLENGVEILGVQTAGSLRFEYVIERIEKVAPPKC
ncbi:MAG: DUF1849 family protein [Alphaproteobacteria bacterium]|nr:DUF1849 family protein [Alphaproteobacteria bacterium]MCW5739930.1 DUF1849 family protein [Alphaproteobacteria bacterium]